MSDVYLAIVVAVGLVIFMSLIIRLGVIGRKNKGLLFFSKVLDCISIFNTLLHELGHLIASVLTGGEAYRIQLYSDRSGFAVTGSRSWLSSVLVKMAGYVSASVIAFGYAWAVTEGYRMIVLWITFGLLVVSVLFYIRNLFGIVWGIFLITITGMIIFNGSLTAQMLFLVVVCSILLFESFVSTMELVILSVLYPRTQTDAKDLQGLTKIPSVVWSLGFFVVGFYFTLKGIQVLVGDWI